jgi:polysaccharide export outer membrane protein
VDVRKLLEGGDESLDLILYPGDRVTVQQTGIVYVIGAGNRPGGYPLKDPQEEMTVLKALALAGDVTNSARRDKLLIMRKKAQASGGRQEVRIDLRKIIANRSPDQRLYGDDILFVPESGKLKAMRQAIGTGVGMGTAITTGIVIYRR